MRSLHGHRPFVLSLVTAGLGAAVLCAGCQETRVIHKRKPILSGLPGSVGGGGEVVPGASRPEILQPVEQIRVSNPDGTVTLRSPTVRDLMRHILQTLSSDERDLFTEQVLSKITRQEFFERGYDPATTFDELIRRRSDLRRLFQAMPAGEFTPGILLEPVGRNVFRLRAEGDESMNWKYMDVVFESGDFKLRWFGR